MAYVKKIWKDYPDTTTPILTEDLNNIENGIETVTNNVNNGWIPLTGTFTYVSWDSSVYTGVVNSNLDLTPYLSVGMKVKFTQNSAIKYAFITAITSTQLTLFLGTDYSLNNSAISNTCYSMLKTPYGFPLDPTIWQLKIAINTDDTITSPIVEQFYNISSASITLPIGLWKVKYIVNAQISVNNTTAFSQITLSETISSITNSEFNSGVSGGSEVIVRTLIQIENYIELITTTQFYLIMRNLTGAQAISFVGTEVPTQIIATIGYL